ncbi:glycosyltransferase family 2 protein [Methanobrevibacter sp.]|uniref:glycosyltransferase family 2 protein n=1 Tax=Methanobrevibacter sp. TaxID=66852 RepID=UPI00388D91F5
MIAKYKVSILISSYNYAHIIEDTFESIKNQTFNFEDIEVIFVDDHSEDNSVEVIGRLADEFDNVKLYHVPEGQKGVSYPRNIGIEKATGDYIVILDADDRLDSMFIEKTYKEITENDVDMVKTSFFMGFDKKISYSQNLGRVVVHPEDVSVLMSSYNYLEPWATMYSRKFLIDNNIRFSIVHKYYEAFLFSIECICKTNKDIILLDNYEGYYWNYKLDGLHNVDVTVEELDNTIECFTEMFTLLVANKQPINCIETFFPFALSLCGSGVYNSTASDFEKASFLCKKAFNLDYVEHDE